MPIAIATGVPIGGGGHVSGGLRRGNASSQGRRPEISELEERSQASTTAHDAEAGDLGELKQANTKNR